MPWRERCDGYLKDNYIQSKTRLISLINRLRDDPEKYQQYKEIIEEQEKDGIIERCKSTPPPGQVHYLPHHFVLRDSSTTKLRIVFDASSNKPSLNDMLEKGPCLLPLLFDILVRFRVYAVALIADIKQAFLNVGVIEIESDRHFLRFLWLEDVKP